MLAEVLGGNAVGPTTDGRPNVSPAALHVSAVKLVENEGEGKGKALVFRPAWAASMKELVITGLAPLGIISSRFSPAFRNRDIRLSDFLPAVAGKLSKTSFNSMGAPILPGDAAASGGGAPVSRGLLLPPSPNLSVWMECHCAAALDGCDSGLRLGFLLSDLLCPVDDNGKQWVPMMVKGAKTQRDDGGKVSTVLHYCRALHCFAWLHVCKYSVSGHCYVEE